MYQINGLYTVTVAGVQQFLAANPGAGRANGTEITDAFLNDVELELLNIVDAADITPAPNTPTQVLAALQILFGGSLQIGSNYYIKKWPDSSSPSGQFIEIGGTATLPASGSTVSDVLVMLPITLNAVLPGSALANCFGGANSTYGCAPGAQVEVISASEIKIQADTMSAEEGLPIVFNQTVPCSYRVQGY